MFIDLEPPKKRCLDRCGENPTALRASIRWREKLKFVSANKSRTEVLERLQLALTTGRTAASILIDFAFRVSAQSMGHAQT